MFVNPFIENRLFSDESYDLFSPVAEIVVFITDCDLGGIDAQREALIHELGARVAVGACRTTAEVIEHGGGADALVVQWAPITREVVQALPRCKLISRYGIGLDMIDVEAATEEGIAVANVSDYCLEEVAGHTTAMLLALSRRLPLLDASVRAGTWDARAIAQGMAPMSELTLGLIGCGRIARLVARPFQALGVHVLASDPVAPAEDGIEIVGLEELLERSDLVSLHCPLTPQTRHLINRRTLGHVKRGAILVNTARGELIDEDALAAALEDGSIAAAALDVFAAEPPASDSPLRKCDNVLLSPHAAWYSDRALQRLRSGAVQNVIDFFLGHPMQGIVNQPAPAATPSGR